MNICISRPRIRGLKFAHITCHQGLTPLSIHITECLQVFITHPLKLNPLSEFNSESSLQRRLRGAPLWKSQRRLLMKAASPKSGVSSTLAWACLRTERSAVPVVTQITTARAILVTIGSHVQYTSFSSYLKSSVFSGVFVSAAPSC